MDHKIVLTDKIRDPQEYPLT